MLEKLNVGILDRLAQASHPRRTPGTSRARLHLLKQLYASEQEEVTAADRLDFFRDSAIQLGIDSYAVSGPLGVYQGSTRDYAVLARYATYRTYDPEYQELMVNHLFAKGRGTLIDIGANIGLTSIPIARERGITCYAFEPEPRTYLYLRQNVLANSVESLVRCFNLALFSDEGVLQLEVAEGNMGDHRVRTEASIGNALNLVNEETRITIEVKASTLDVIFKGKSLEPPIVVKNDTQGSEVRVLRGASEFLAQVHYLVSEFEPYLVNRIGDSVSAYIELLAQFPYGALLESPDDLQRERSSNALRLDPMRLVLEKMKTFAEKASGSEDYANLIVARHPEFPSA